jgi:DNA-directed RNA polymerase subunit RPC12/RpoP
MKYPSNEDIYNENNSKYEYDYEKVYKCHRCDEELNQFNDLDVNEYGDIFCHACNDWCLENEIN